MTQDIKLVNSIKRESGLTDRQIKVLEEEGIDFRRLGVAIFDATLTEENTDIAIDLLLSHINLPVWLRWLPLRNILDGLLPGPLRKVFVTLLYREG